MDMSNTEIEQAIALSAHLDILLSAITVTTCIACSGSGYYDSGSSPRCGSCGGGGKEMGYELAREIRAAVWSLYDLDDELGQQADAQVAKVTKDLGVLV